LFLVNFKLALDTVALPVPLSLPIELAISAELVLGKFKVGVPLLNVQPVAFPLVNETLVGVKVKSPSIELELLVNAVVVETAKFQPVAFNLVSVTCISPLPLPETVFLA